MATYTKTATEVMAPALSTNPATAVSSAVDVSTKISCTLFMFFGSIEDATANTNPQRFIVQTSALATGNEDWSDWRVFTVSKTGTLAREAITGGPHSGDNVTCASTTGFETAGQDVYVQDASVVADGEWASVEDFVSNTSVTFYDTLTNTKDSSDFLNAAEVLQTTLDLSSVLRLRVIFENEGGTAVDCHYKVLMTSADSIG